jgi:hypothetical protein
VACQTLGVIIVKSQIGLVVVAHAPASWASVQISAAIFIVESALAGIQSGKVIAIVNGGDRIADEVIASMGKGGGHGRTARLCGGEVK